MITKHQVLKLLESVNLQRIARRMVEIYDENSTNIALFVQENSLEIIPLFPGTRIKDAFVLYVLPLNWEDSFEVEGTQQDLLAKLKDPDKVIEKEKELKAEHIYNELKNIIKMIKDEENAEWATFVENGNLVIEKNGEPYAEVDLDSVEDEVIEKHPLN